MEPCFVHLHVHSEYSLIDGIVRIKPLIEAVAEGGMPAVALTDQSNLFALVKFYKAALAGGIKPIIGCDCLLEDPEDPANPHRLLLLVRDRKGYGNLTELVSRAYTEGQRRGSPRLQRAWIEARADGLIALSGGRDGDVARRLSAGREADAEALLERWLGVFGDRYYLEVTRTGRPGEETWLHAAVDLAARKGVPVVASNDVRFLRAEEFESHETRVCIHDGHTLDDPHRPRLYSEQQYLRSAAEMAELFSDLPEALANSVEIAKRCNLELSLGRHCLPDFPTPEGMSVAEFLRAEARRGLEQRLQRRLDPAAGDYGERRRPYEQRLETELDVIVDMGFPGYFLIVADFIQWAKDNGIPVGPGRGSGAGSLVAYALKITDLDPLEHELLFERFLNPERVSMPDFDVDFCMDNRDRVIDYVARRYGRDAVSQIITYGSMAAKAVVRDVGRVLGHPYGFVDRIAKLVPFEIGMTLDKALAESEDLKRVYDEEEEVRALIDRARALEGLARNAGKHAGGVVIAPGRLTDFTPLYCEPDGSGLVTQLDKDDVEAVGLVKFDFLGLRTLTIIDWTLKNIARQHPDQVVDITAIPRDDPEAFALLKRCETTAVFQLESRGMKELIKKLQPDCFEDITALVALFRPGPLQSGMVDDFIARKHGRAEVAYPHPALEPILEPTYGVILYQEQVMQIAQVLAGYTLGGADLLRRAMGKKKASEMAKQRDIFMRGAVERGVDEAVASHIFDLMEKFAGYGFNKSHSAAYALVSYQTLWLKAHYPAAFMAAVLSSDMDNTDKVVTFIEECRAMDLEVAPPDVNRSQHPFTVDGERTIVYGLGAVKGVGEAAIEGILKAREAEGPFHDLFDFCRRIDLRKANRRALEALIRAGALDGLGANRATLMLQLPLALKLAEQHHATASTGQADLFALDDAPSVPVLDPRTLPHADDEWEDEQRLLGEKETLGLYLTGHPIDRYGDEPARLTTHRLGEIQALEASHEGGRQAARKAVVCGLVVDARHRNTQRGRMGSVTLDDRTGRMEVALFSESYERYRELLTLDKVLVIGGTLAMDEYRGAWTLRAERVHEFEEARAAYAERLELRIAARDGDPQAVRTLVAALREHLAAHRGGRCAVRLHCAVPGAQGVLRLGDDWRVEPRDALLKGLGGLLGEDGVRVVYGKGPVPEERPMQMHG